MRIPRTDRCCRRWAVAVTKLFGPGERGVRPLAVHRRPLPVTMGRSSPGLGSVPVIAAYRPVGADERQGLPAPPIGSGDRLLATGGRCRCRATAAAGGGGAGAGAERQRAVPPSGGGRCRTVAPGGGQSGQRQRRPVARRGMADWPQRQSAWLATGRNGSRHGWQPASPDGPQQPATAARRSQYRSRPGRLAGIPARPPAAGSWRMPPHASQGGRRALPRPAPAASCGAPTHAA